MKNSIINSMTSINNLSEVEISFIIKNKKAEYRPQISNDVKCRIIELIAGYLNSRLANDELVPYDSTGVLDNQIEFMDISVLLNSVHCANFFDDKLQLEETNLQPEKIDYYEIIIKNNNNQIMKVYRQFQKMKQLRKGLFSFMHNHELKRIDGNIICIDGTIDILIWNNQVIIFNHIALERILNFKDVFIEKTMEAIAKLKHEDIMLNVEQFEDDCINDSRIIKKFHKIMTQNKLNLFFKHFSKVKTIVDELGFNISFSKDGKIIYEDKKQLFHIVNLMSDSYFRSLLANRIGIAEKEGNIR